MNATEILHAVSHRELPPPTTPWVMAQTWLNLLFAHYPLSPTVLRPLIPSILDIDTFELQAWVGVIPFQMRDVHPRWLPSVNCISHFPELNVTYKGYPGVYFFSLEASNPLAVAIARSVFHLPYFNARMSCESNAGTWYYSSHRTHHNTMPADYLAKYRPTGPVDYAHPYTIAHWLTERYSLYTTFHNRLYRGEIHHAPWPLQPAELETIKDTMALSHSIHLPDTQPLLHFSQRQDVLIWSLRRLI